MDRLIDDLPWLKVKNIKIKITLNKFQEIDGFFWPPLSLTWVGSSHEGRKWLGTMVIVSPLSRFVEPFPNDPDDL